MKALKFAALVFALFAIMAIAIWRSHPRDELKRRRGNPPPPFQITSSTANNTSNAQRSLGTKASDMTPSEMAELSKAFDERLEPAVVKWCEVYAGRVPFKPDDVTFEKFHSRLGANNYTFMIGDTTLTIKDSGKEGRVTYMMTRSGARSLNSLPPPGATPDISMPISRSDILALLKSDAGFEYPPDQIQISATGKAGALGGGVSVESGGIMGNGVYRAMTLTNLDFVLGPDGKLVYYLR